MPLCNAECFIFVCFHVFPDWNLLKYSAQKLELKSVNICSSESEWDVHWVLLIEGNDWGYFLKQHLCYTYHFPGEINSDQYECSKGNSNPSSLPHTRICVAFGYMFNSVKRVRMVMSLLLLETLQ